MNLSKLPRRLLSQAGKARALVRAKAPGPGMEANQNRPSGAIDWQSPIRKGYLVVAVTLGIGGIWAATARLDSAVMAHGNVVVESDRKSVQHLEGGLIRTIAVRDGVQVQEGDVLLQLDPTQALAQRSVAELGVLQALGEEARLSAEAAGLATIAFPPELTAPGVPNEAQRIIADQQRQFRDRASGLRLEVSILGERLTQAQRQYDSTKSQRDAAVAQVGSINDELAKLRPLADQGYVAATRINPLQRTLSELNGRVGSLDADLARLTVANEEIRLQSDQVMRRAAEDASHKLTEARGRLAEAREKLRIADDVLTRTQVRAPRAGRVVGSKVHTVGAVIRPGDTLMEIVPEDDDLVVSAKVSPMDVNSLHPGMPAEVRLPSFKGRRTPVTIGEVKSVAADTVRDEVSQQQFYALKVSVRASGFPESVRNKLRPGMPAEVLVATGERTVLTYLLQPLTDSMRSGFREE